MRALTAVRSAYLRSPEDAITARVTGTLLEALRHRGLPPIPDFALPDEPELRFVTADSLVLQRLFWFGRRGWEPEVSGWWRHFCREAQEVLELGANVGYHTVRGGLALADGARLVAVEPHPGSAAILRANVSLNGLDDRVEVVEAAASAGGEPEVELFVPVVDHWATPAGAFVGAGEVDRSHGRGITVRSVAVNSLYRCPDLMKLDVEGGEAALLEALGERLSVDRPTIFVEVLDDTPLLRKVLRRLVAEAGYDCYIPRRDGRLVLLPPGALGDARLEHDAGTRDVIVTCAKNLPERPDED